MSNTIVLDFRKAYALKAFSSAIQQNRCSFMIPSSNQTLAILDDFDKGLSGKRTENHIEISALVFWRFFMLSDQYMDARRPKHFNTAQTLISAGYSVKPDGTVLIPHDQEHRLKNYATDLKHTLCEIMFRA